MLITKKNSGANSTQLVKERNKGRKKGSERGREEERKEAGREGGKKKECIKGDVLSITQVNIRMQLINRYDQNTLYAYIKFSKNK